MRRRNMPQFQIMKTLFRIAKEGTTMGFDPETQPMASGNRRVPSAARRLGPNSWSATNIIAFGLDSNNPNGIADDTMASRSSGVG